MNCKTTGAYLIELVEKLQTGIGPNAQTFVHAKADDIGWMTTEI